MPDGLAPSKTQTSTSMSKFGAVWGCTKPVRCAAVVAAEGGMFLVAFFVAPSLSLPLVLLISLFYTDMLSHFLQHPWPTSSPSFSNLLLNHCDYFVLGSRTFYNFALWFSDWFGFWIIDFVLLPNLNCLYVCSGHVLSNSQSGSYRCFSAVLLSTTLVSKVFPSSLISILQAGGGQM